MRVITNCLWGGLFLAGALYGVLAVQRAVDSGFQFHGVQFLVFCAAAVCQETHSARDSRAGPRTMAEAGRTVHREAGRPLAGSNV